MTKGSSIARRATPAVPMAFESQGADNARGAMLDPLSLLATR